MHGNISDPDKSTECSYITIKAHMSLKKLKAFSFGTTIFSIKTPHELT